MQICFFRTLFYFHFHQIIEDPEFIVVFGARPGFMSVFEHKLYAAPRVFSASSIRAREPRGEWDGTCPAGYARYSLPFFFCRSTTSTPSKHINASYCKFAKIYNSAATCTRRFVYFFVLFFSSNLSWSRKMFAICLFELFCCCLLSGWLLTGGKGEWHWPWQCVFAATDNYRDTFLWILGCLLSSSTGGSSRGWWILI